MTGRCNLQLGLYHQRMAELSVHLHGLGWNGARVAGDEIHQSKADRGHARMRCNGVGAAHGQGRLQQNMQRNVAAPGGINLLGGAIHIFQ